MKYKKYDRSHMNSVRGYITHDNLKIPIELRCVTSIRRLVYYLLCVFTFGLIFFISRWFRSLRYYILTRTCKVEEANVVLIELGEKRFLPVYRCNLTHVPQVQRVFSKYITNNTLYYFVYKYDRFLYNKDLKRFEQPDADSFVRQLYVSKGQSKMNVELLRNMFGQNKLEIQNLSILEFVLWEVTSPLTLIQIIACINWMSNNYIAYPLCVIIVSCKMLYQKIRERLYVQNQISELVENYTKLVVIRENARISLSSSELVVGDLIELPIGPVTVTCDFLLIEGECIVDESILTGESVPVTKIERSVIFAGTKILKSKNRTKKTILGVVYKVGYQTSQGFMLKSLLTHTDSKHKFHYDLIKLLTALVAISVVFVIASSLLIMKNNFTLQNFRSILSSKLYNNALEFLTIIVPTDLPSIMETGMLSSLERLRKRKIMCMENEKVFVSGKLNVFCFDKTGTLTREGLELAEVVSFSDEQKLEIAMLTCHSICVIDNEICGDPLDTEMFNYVRKNNETLEETPYGALTVRENTIVRTFDFSLELRRISVIVENTEGLWVFTKGSPESIAELCDELPDNYYAVVERYSSCGYRVIAIAHKKITQRSLTRGEAECEMEILGLLVFDNKLKDQTCSALYELKSAGFEVRMITGDSIMTAISVAKACHIVHDVPLFIVNVKESALEWVSYDGSYELDPVRYCVRRDEQLHHYLDFQLACTGDVFEHIIEQSDENVIRILGKRCVVYARSDPQQKQKIVSMLKNSGFCVGYCGDGANDCGALKEADVGVSLSSSDVSLAGAFSSRIPNVSCVVRIVLEGYQGLTSAFDYLHLLVFCVSIQGASRILLQLKDESLCLNRNQYLYLDMIMTLPLGLTMMRSQASERVSKRRPTMRVFCKETILSFLFEFLIVAISQVIVYFFFKEKIVFAMFITAAYQTLFSSLASLTGKPFKKPSYCNTPFLVTVTLLFVSNAVMLFCCPKFVCGHEEVVDMRLDEKLLLFALQIFYLIGAFPIRTIIVPYVTAYKNNELEEDQELE